MLFIFMVAFLLSSVKAGFIMNTTYFWCEQVNFRLPFQIYSGYENLDWHFEKDSTALYYSLYQGYNSPWEDKSIPIIIWLEGGPGRSSQFGCHNGVGPLLIDDRNKVNELQWSISTFGHVMCVDQPAGVGFSYKKNTKVINSTDEEAHNFINFLYNFYLTRPNLRNNPLYLAGEGFASHFILSIAEKIISNKTLNMSRFLKGVILESAFVDPVNQVSNFDNYFYSAGVASEELRAKMQSIQTEINQKISAGEYSKASILLNSLIKDKTITDDYNGVNIFNYKQYEQRSYNSKYGEFLNKNKNSFGVLGTVAFVDNNEEMYKNFYSDFTKSSKANLEIVLNNGIKTLIINGQNDFVVNTPGVLKYLENLNWTSAQAWSESEKVNWKGTYNKNSLGWYKRYNNLILFHLRDTGHYNLLDNWINSYDIFYNYFMGGFRNSKQIDLKNQ